MSVPTPVRNTPDGVYFVSSAPEGQPNSSGYAYYANLKDGGNDNEQPDAFAIADTFHQPHGEAEGVTFPDGTRFGWSIPFDDFPGNGNDPPFQSAVGFATNNFEDAKKWTCYKDNDRVLFTKDGVEWTTLFWCF